jgi:hypothetical protein
MGQLYADPQWLSRAHERERSRSKSEAEMRRAEAPIVDDLAACGVSVRSVWDLVNTRDRYPAATPVLLDHLSRPYRVEIREGIARALGVREARASAWGRVLELLDQEPDRRVRDGLFVAIAGMAGPSDILEIINLVSQRALGPSRVFLIRNLMRSKRAEARATLISLKDDPDLKEEIRHRLGIK